MSSTPSPDPQTSDHELMSHYDSVFGFLLRRTQKRFDAEDLTQETIFRFLRWRKDRTLADSKRMLFQIAQNLLIDRSRRRTVRGIVGPEDSAPEAKTDLCPYRKAVAHEELASFKEALAQMPSRPREVFVMNRMLGLRHKEIAQRLGISNSTVKKHMSQALRYARDFLEERE